jgi:rare lipoprotein A
MRMDQQIDRFWRVIRLQGLVVFVALSLVACATPKYDVGRPMIGARNAAPRPSDMVGPTGKPLRGTEKPYQINGVWYYPKEDRDYNVVGTGSWYGEQFHNRRTANGEIFDMDIPSAAHKTLPLPSLVEVTNLDNGRRMIVRVNDRGPFVGDRVIDLSKAAAEELGYRRQGVAKVRVKYIGPAPKSVFDPPRQYARAPSRAEPSVRGFEAIQEPPQRVQVLPAKSEPEWSPSPSLSAPPINPPDPVKRASPLTTTASVTPAAKAGFRIQAGAFSSRENAEKAVQQLALAGSARIEPLERPSGTLYRVVVAAGDDEGEAWSLRQRVEALGYAGATVLRP